jgi:hypothetical protein
MCEGNEFCDDLMGRGESLDGKLFPGQQHSDKQLILHLRAF